jgi:hypothetical protein
LAQKGALFAAADAMVTGGIIVPEFQKEITDLVRRAGVLGQRIQYVPATGSPSRWFEEDSFTDGQFTDPHAIAPTAATFTRSEHSLLIRAITNEVSYSLFDMETVAQQAQFAYLKAKDMRDMVNGILRLRDKSLWNGNDTVSGLQVGGGNAGSLQYVGLLNQLKNPVTIASGANIVDGIRTEVANLVNNTGYMVRPTAIYINPIGLDYLEQEAKNNSTAMRWIQSDITDGKVGISVTGIVTAAGVLPLIPEPFLSMDATIPGITAATAPAHNYPFVILTEELVEFHYIGSKEPRVFQLGTIANLNETYVGVQFGAVTVKGASYAHSVGVIQR